MSIMNSDDRFLIVKGYGTNKKTSQFAQSYAASLAQVLSQIKNVEVTEISEEEYQKAFLCINDDSTNLRSKATRCIMFGSDKFIEDQEYCSIKKYEMYGISYGWLGNDCTIRIDPRKIKSEDVPDYLKYYKKKQDILADFEFIFEGDMSATELSARKNAVGKKCLEIYANGLNPFNKTSAKEMVDGYLSALIAAPLLGYNFPDILIAAGGKVGENSKFIESQYQVAVCDFLINGFKNFIEATDRKEKKATLIAVIYDKKNYKYAQLLKNAIIEFSDYNAVIFSEENYKSNSWKISSKNRIIFLGESGVSDQTTFTIPSLYNNYNTQFGYRGSYAFIKVGKRISSKSISALQNDYNYETERLSQEIVNKGMASEGYFPTLQHKKDILGEWEDVMYKFICMKFVIEYLDDFAER